MDDLSLYCPYDIIDDPLQFGLTSTVVESTFGKLYVVKPAAATTSTGRLFLHGVGGSWASWTPLLQEMSAQGIPFDDCVFIDIPGFGRSENVKTNLDAAVIGEELISMMRDFGWETIELIGHSMGGFLTLDMATQDSGAIRKLTVISGAYFGVVDTVNSPLAALKTSRGTAITYLSMTALAYLGPLGKGILKIADNTGILPKILTRLVAKPKLLRRSIAKAMADGIRPRSFRLAAKNGLNYDAKAEWAKIVIPMVATFGAEDELVSAKDMVRLEESNPEAEVTVFEGVGHFAPVERPDLIANLLFK